MHVFGVIVWLGGLMFQTVVASPALREEGDTVKRIRREMAGRFTGFIWMSVWTVGVTGVIMMLLDRRFLWFSYPDRWSVLLGWKEAVFVLMVIYAYAYTRMLRYLDAPSSNGGFDERAELYRHRVDQFRSISIALGLLALFLAAAMVVYG